MINQTISHYRILSKLGEGAMSEVYIAEDLDLGREVAFKILSNQLDLPQFRARMRREARAISSLSHPRIATIHQYGETPEGQPFIVMELVRGQTLSGLLRGGQLTLTRALEIVEGIAEGVSEAHRHGIVHRDIKPSNVAINERGEIKILDFGLAKQLDSKVLKAGGVARASEMTETRWGDIIGTPLYMSPEQAQGGIIDERSDLFSLGSLLYECVTGQPAFDDRNAIAVCARVIRDDPQPPSYLNPEVPPGLDRVTLKALAKKAESRYQTADEMLEELRAVRRELSMPGQLVKVAITPAVDRPETSIVKTLTDALRRPRVAVAAFLVTLTVSATVAWVAATGEWGAATRPTPVVARNYYEDGVSALRDGTYYKSVRALEKALSIHDDYPIAHARLAEAWNELDHTDRAKSELLKVASASHDGRTHSPSDALYLQAITLKLSGDSQGAIDKYLAIANQATVPEKPAAYVDLGRAYEKDGNIVKALECYQRALEIDPQFTAALMRAGVLTGRQLDEQSTRSAFALLQEAETRYQILNDLEGQAEVFYERGFMFMTRRKTEEARAQFAQGLAKASAIDNKYQQIKIRMQLSSVACLENKTAEARLLASETLDFAKSNGLEAAAISGLVSLGNSFTTTNPEVAREYLEQALNLARYYNARRGQARAALALANLHGRHQGRADKVQEYVDEASTILEQEGVRKYAMQAHALLGHASDELGDYDAALEAFRKQLRLAEQLDDQDQVAFAHDGLGIVLNHKEQYEESLKHLDESYKISQLHKIRLYIGHVQLARGQALSAMGRYPEARAAFAEALSVAKGGDEPNSELLAWYHLGVAQLELSRREFGEAKAESQKAIELAEMEFAAVAAEAKYTNGMAHAFAGDEQNARRLCREALDAAERSRSPRLIGGALLALSAVMLEGGDARGASENALKAQEIFSRAGQTDSEWRSWEVAAAAFKRSGDGTRARESASRAAELLSTLRRQLGDDYMRRPDVLHARERLRLEFNLNI